MTKTIQLGDMIAGEGLDQDYRAGLFEGYVQRIEELTDGRTRYTITWANGPFMASMGWLTF